MNGFTSDFEAVRADELEWLAKRRVAEGLPPPADDLVGLAFSGGGIRSAVFNLGVLQALEKGKLMPKVDYLSTVSGGGYIGSCYSWLRASLARGEGSVFDAPLRGHGGTALDWVRGHGKYLVSHRGFSIWTLLGSIFASTFANVFVIGPALLFAIWALTLSWLPVQWPDALALPGLAAPEAHHGFWLLLAAGAACVLAFPPAALLFALVAGVPHLSNVRTVNGWRVFLGRLLVYGLALIALGLIPVLAMLGSWAENYFSSPHAHSFGTHVAWLTPLLSGLGSMLADKLRGGAGRGRLATIGVALVLYGILVGCYLIVTDPAVVRSIPFMVGAALSVLLAFVCDINRVSIHSYYRARLSDAFLPPVEGAASADPGNFDLDKIGPEKGAPLQLINTTLNTSNSSDERDRARLGACFSFSPLYSGSQPTGWRRLDDYAGGSLALSTAFTISGAAVDPDSYATDARPIAFLMALLNVRLGFWAKSPHCGHKRLPILPRWWVFIGREMLGIGLDARRHHVHLSDGGGFENLAIYELIRRRVPYIVVCDAGEDPQLSLSDLGRAIERVRVDFGAQVHLDADRMYHQREQVLEQQPWVLGSVSYADGTRGEILYIKPMLCAGLTADIYAYWRANPSFPDESTAEQFFAEPQFEAYRMLGYQIVQKLLGEEGPRSIPDWFGQLRTVADAAKAS